MFVKINLQLMVLWQSIPKVDEKFNSLKTINVNLTVALKE